MDRRPSARSLWALVLLVLVVSGGSQWLHARGEARLGAALASAARPGDILLLSSETCPYCAAARSWLREHRVPFDECFIERDAACSAAYTAAGSRGTPTVLVRGGAQTGFDAERVMRGLDAAGPPLTPPRS